MKNTTSTFLTIILLTIISIQVNAQDEKKLTSGNSLNIVIPQGKLAETYDHGFGVYANL